MSDIVNSILLHKKDIDDRLVSYLTKKKKLLSQINSYGGDVINRLILFTTSGKSTRGSLSVYTYRLFTHNETSNIYDAAAALELYHSGFLIHDDIMDEDRLRRGRKSIWEQYRHITHSKYKGMSQAINAGDLCFFLAQELLSDTDLSIFTAREFAYVVIAQMQDVENTKGKIVTSDEIVTLYRYKTARYTFSLSMTVGARLAGVERVTIETLQRLGESMGLLYQIRDDELSIYGNSAITGKPLYSDIRNEKQTLAELLNSEDINDLKSEHMEHCDREIAKLPILDKHKEELRELVIFCLQRKK